MTYQVSTKTVKVQVPATSGNLGPGFDVLALALKLYNTIEMEVSSEAGLKIEIEGEGKDSLPRDKRNIVYRSAETIFRMFDFHPRGVRIRMVNRIPLARGLGSSASARVGGLLAANKLVGDRLSKEEIITLAAKLEGHPDNVAGAVMGGLVASCVVLERGKRRVRTVNMIPSRDVGCVICVPDFPLLTENARKILPGKIMLQDAVFNFSHLAMLLFAFFQRRYNLLELGMEDRVHQPYRTRLVKGMAQVFKAGLDAGALGVCLSGAGPSILALVPPSARVRERVGMAMEKAFKRYGVDSKSLIVEIDTAGATVT